MKYVIIIIMLIFTLSLFNESTNDSVNNETNESLRLGDELIKESSKLLKEIDELLESTYYDGDYYSMVRKTLSPDSWELYQKFFF